MSKANIFYAQSGGVTSVINASACGVIEAARRSRAVGRVLVGQNGILGALNEELIDTALESKRDIAMLRHTPSGAFGSCRYKRPKWRVYAPAYLWSLAGCFKGRLARASAKRAAQNCTMDRNA